VFFFEVVMVLVMVANTNCRTGFLNCNSTSFTVCCLSSNLQNCVLCLKQQYFNAVLSYLF